MPDIVVLDLSLSDIDGAAAIQAMRDGAPKAKVVVLSVHDHSEIARGALRAGANAYVLQSDATPELATAIRTVSSRNSLPQRTLRFRKCSLIFSIPSSRLSLLRSSSPKNNAKSSPG